MMMGGLGLIFSASLFSKNVRFFVVFPMR